MTTEKSKSLSKYTPLITLGVTALAAFLSFSLSPVINEYTKSGLSLCFSVVIGSVFPFMILTDLIASKSVFESISPLKLVFERLFRINGSAISAFACGALCGFPLGVKVAADLYKRGIITKDECERLIGFSNNTGPAFVISGIGVALLNSFKYGILIYASMLLSAIAVGFIFGFGHKASRGNLLEIKSDFVFVDSLKSGALNTLSICGFVVIFSVIFGLIALFIKHVLALTFISSFIEVSNAAKTISGAAFLSSDMKLALISFAVSFSGISVHMQAKSFLAETDVSMKRYYIMKLLQGAIALVIARIFIKITKM